MYPPGAPSQRPKAFTVGLAEGHLLQAKLTEDGRIRKHRDTSSSSGKTSCSVQLLIESMKAISYGRNQECIGITCEEVGIFCRYHCMVVLQTLKRVGMQLYLGQGHL